jgi:uncharacterized Zn finger protein
MDTSEKNAPRHCPFCGAHVTVVRRVLENMFKVACDRCGRVADVVLDPVASAARSGPYGHEAVR